MSIVINQFNLSNPRLEPGMEFTATINATNNAWHAGKSIGLWGFAYVSYTDADGAQKRRQVAVLDQQETAVNWPVGATQTFTIAGVVKPNVKQILDGILETDPAANIRFNDIHWVLEVHDREAGGFNSGEADAGILLYKYWQPAIERFNIERSANGLPDDEGVSLLTSIKLGLSERANSAAVGLALYYSDSGPATEEDTILFMNQYIPSLLEGVEDSPLLIPGEFSNTKDWHFLLLFGDEYEMARAEFSISRAFANMHLSGKTTGGVAFGGFSKSEEGNPMAEFHYPIHAYEKIYAHDGIEGVTNYSTSETKTGGTWIDGKPIYRYIINTTFVGGGFSTDVGTLPYGVENIIRCNGMTKGASDNSWRPLTFVYPHGNLNQWGISFFVDTANKVYVQSGSAFANVNNKLIMIFEYTKS